MKRAITIHFSCAWDLAWADPGADSAAREVLADPTVAWEWAALAADPTVAVDLEADADRAGPVADSAALEGVAPQADSAADAAWADPADVVAILADAAVGIGAAGNGAHRATSRP